ncbi:imm11 family protein [Wenyingzhuangia sp. IMCC45533]
MKVNVNSEDVGKTFPQVNCYSLKDAHSLKHYEFPNFEPKLKFTLNKKGKLSDIIGQVAINASGILISKKLKFELEKFNLINHKFFKATIKEKFWKKGEEYFWLHLCNPENLNWIDFINSKFFITEYGFKQREIKINSTQDLIIREKEIGKMGWIEAEKIKLKITQMNEIDLFNFNSLSNEIHVSERLKKHLESLDLKGIIFEQSICS